MECTVTPIYIYIIHITYNICNHRALTGRGLQQFFIVYCKMFQEGGTSFPKVGLDT